MSRHNRARDERLKSLHSYTKAEWLELYCNLNDCGHNHNDLQPKLTLASFSLDVDKRSLVSSSSKIDLVMTSTAFDTRRVVSTGSSNVIFPYIQVRGLFRTTVLPQEVQD